MHISLKKPLVYVTRDIERALGMEPSGDYFIISNDSPFGNDIERKHPGHVWLVRSLQALDTFDLLMLPDVQQTIKDHDADIIVFQNTPRIERLAQERGWNLINPKADLAIKVEEKISQIEWLGDDASLLPPHRVCALTDVTYDGKRFVLQFNHSHTGQGTFVIESNDALTGLRDKFPQRICRVVEFIDGPIFTVNSVVGDAVIVGNPSYQITGISPFTDLPFSTIGNDWSLPRIKEYEAAYADTVSIAQRIGEKLQSNGWKGLFGIDVVYDKKSGKTFLLEINARQPASAAFESTLQKKNTIFEAHVRSLLGLSIKDFKSTQITSGSQVVKRMTGRSSKVDLDALRSKELNVIEYENTDLNKELLRIQSSMGIMKDHNAFNELGESIKSCIQQ